MRGDFAVTFHEVIPESTTLELVATELGYIQADEHVRCSVVVSRRTARDRNILVHVELRSDGSDTNQHAEAVGLDQYDALRRAFAALRRVRRRRSQAAARARRTQTLH